ncbi:glycosyltransferase family 2 protein [bacterium]|nr:glycosyltransferase family 2 protein [candidate division CSSED10-310 bacterium]
MGKIPITVLIPCFNEELNIRDCLDRVLWADEILLVDSFSTDRTLDIAREYPVSILQHEYINSAAQKNWAIPQAKHDWVLIVDSDERVSPELREEIHALFDGVPSKDGYWIRRKNYLLGRQVRHSGWGNDRVLRLFRKDLGRYQRKRVHAQVDLQNVGELNAYLLHYSINSVSQWLEKINRYTTWKSQDKFESGFRAPLLQGLIRPELRFIRDYFVKLGFLDGFSGFLIAVMSGMAEFLMSVKVLSLGIKSRGLTRRDP